MVIVRRALRHRQLRVAVRVAKYDAGSPNEVAAFLGVIAVFSSKQNHGVHLEIRDEPDVAQIVEMARVKTKQERAAKRARKAAEPDLRLSATFKLGLSIVVLAFFAFGVFETHLLYSRAIRQKHGVVVEIDDSAKSLSLQIAGRAELLECDIKDVPPGDWSDKLRKGAHVSVTYREALWGRKQGLTVKVLKSADSQSHARVPRQ